MGQSQEEKPKFEPHYASFNNGHEIVAGLNILAALSLHDNSKGPLYEIMCKIIDFTNQTPEEFFRDIRAALDYIMELNRQMENSENQISVSLTENPPHGKEA